MDVVHALLSLRLTFMQVKMTSLVIAESEVMKHKSRFTFHLNGMTSNGQNSAAETVHGRYKIREM
jgi:hypothetical protein